MIISLSLWILTTTFKPSNLPHQEVSDTDDSPSDTQAIYALMTHFSLFMWLTKCSSITKEIPGGTENGYSHVVKTILHCTNHFLSMAARAVTITWCLRAVRSSTGTQSNISTKQRRNEISFILHLWWIDCLPVEFFFAIRCLPTWAQSLYCQTDSSELKLKPFNLGILCMSILSEFEWSKQISCVALMGF